MKIVCAANMPFVREAFQTLGDVSTYDGRAITAGHVRDAELLALRSTTPVNKALLDGSPVRFVGTATIGIDHMDVDYLEQAGIHWCHAPGCNANSVAEFITAALLCLSVRHDVPLAGRRLGVVGIGNVGSLVVQRGRTLGMEVLQNDPPRARGEGLGRRDADGNQVPFLPLAAVLAAADVISLHVPLTMAGRDKTFHLADADLFRAMQPGAILLNAARGAIVETAALVQAIERGAVGHAVIDTWEGEPGYTPALLEKTALATPHIAGYSFEGKVMGTVMVYREACRFLGVEPAWSHEPLMPEPPTPHINVTAGGRRDEEVLWDVVRRVYDIEADDQRLRDTQSLAETARARAFDEQRKHYPVRREFSYTTVHLPDASPTLRQKLTALGFRT